VRALPASEEQRDQVHLIEIGKKKKGTEAIKSCPRLAALLPSRMFGAHDAHEKKRGQVHLILSLGRFRQQNGVRFTYYCFKIKKGVRVHFL
jgi:uncharacterized protein (DUF302 family)